METKMVNVKEYALDIISENSNRTIKAYKFGFVHAIHGKTGEKIVTYTGDNKVETVGFVKNENDWILTKMIDGKLTDNSWIVKNDVFVKNYECESNDIYRPKKVIKTFIQIEESISFVAPWGQIMNIDAGGYLCVDNIDDIYGISKADFDDTYVLEK